VDNFARDIVCSRACVLLDVGVRQNVAARASASAKLHSFAQHVVVRQNDAGAREVRSQTPWILASATK